MKTPLSRSKLGRAGPSKPALRMRKIKLAGRSAYPQQKAAFGPRDPLVGAPSRQLDGASPTPIAPPVSGAAGPGPSDA